MHLHMCMHMHMHMHICDMCMHICACSKTVWYSVCSRSIVVKRFGIPGVFTICIDNLVMLDTYCGK